MNRFVKNLALFSVLGCMTCCGGCDNKMSESQKSKMFNSVIKEFCKKHSDEEANLKKILPGLLMLKKIVLADDEFDFKAVNDNNQLPKSVVDFLNEPSDAKLQQILDEAKKAGIDKPIKFVEAVYPKVYEGLSEKNTFRKVVGDELKEVPDSELKNSGTFLHLSTSDLNDYKDAIWKDWKDKNNKSEDEMQKKKKEDKLSVSCVINQHFKSKGYLLSEHTEFLVVMLDSFEGLKLKQDFGDCFLGALCGVGTLSYVCAFTDSAYDAQSGIFDKKSPIKLDELKFDKLGDEQVVIVFHVSYHAKQKGLGLNNQSDSNKYISKNV